jgi:hypothetical protein
MEEKTFPEIVLTKCGFTVKISQRVSVPGYFTTRCRAERAVKKHMGLKSKAKKRAKELVNIRKENRANG